MSFGDWGGGNEWDLSDALAGGGGDTSSLFDFGGGSGSDFLDIGNLTSNIGSANPATFSEGPGATSTPVNPPNNYNDPSSFTTSNQGVPAPPGQPIEQSVVPPKNPSLEAEQTPGQWWNQTYNNAMGQVQKNPWGAAGYGLAGAGMLANAIRGGMNSNNGPRPQPGNFPSYPPQTNQDQTLPPAGPGVSPILRNNGAFNVRAANGLR